MPTGVPTQALLDEQSRADLRAIAAGERAAAHTRAAWLAELKAPLAEFYRRLARFSTVTGADAPEERAFLAGLVADAESIDRRLDRFLREEPREDDSQAARELRPAPGPGEADSAAEESDEITSVLVVDDDQETLGCLQELLSTHFEVLVAANGIEGGRLAREHKPSVIVTDLCMPQVDGFALLSIVRHNEDTAHIPLLVLSAVADTDAKVRAFDAGAFDYLTKPVAPREIIARLRKAVAHSRDLRRERMLQATDDLTGLANRRRLREFLSSALRQAARTRTELTVVSLDQNGLKAINDRHGHESGDLAIQAVAKALLGSKRAGDCAARIGGDEFVVVMPGSDRAGAESFIQRMEEALSQMPIPVEHGEWIQVTVSCGVASSSDVAWEESCEQILRRADQALYVEKEKRGLPAKARRAV